MCLALASSVLQWTWASTIFCLSLSPSGWFRSLGWGVLRLHSALFSTSIKSTRKSSMLYFTTSIYLFLCLSLLRCPRASASKILLTQSSSSRRCTCSNHLNLASHTLSIIHSFHSFIQSLIKTDKTLLHNKNERRSMKWYEQIVQANANCHYIAFL